MVSTSSAGRQLWLEDLKRFSAQAVEFILRSFSSILVLLINSNHLCWHGQGQVSSLQNWTEFFEVPEDAPIAALQLI